jgi:hypothetical protein
MLRIIGMLFVYWFDDVVAVFLVDAVSQQLWQRDQQVPVLPRHAERVPPWWCVCLSCLWDYSWIFFSDGYLINKTPWNFDHLHSLKPYFLGLIYFVILWCWNRLLSLDHKYLNEPVMLEYVGVCFFRSYMHTTIGSTGVGMGLIHLSTSGAGWLDEVRCTWTLALSRTSAVRGWRSAQPKLLLAMFGCPP